jgi:hypothetical protein
MSRLRRGFALPCTISRKPALVGAVFASAVLVSSVPARAATTTFSPTADASINARQPHTNYGNGAKLRADGRPRIRSYLRFDVQLPAGAVIDAAVLKLYATRPRVSRGFTVNAVSTTGWSENRISYANAPSLASRLGRSGRCSGAGYKGVALPASAVQAGLNSFAIRTASRSAIRFSSREGSHKPKLWISYAVPDSTPPPAPTPASAPSPTPGTGAMPTGVPGIWRLAFDDEFDGSGLDASKWTDSWFNGGTMNNVPTSRADVSVSGGLLHLQLNTDAGGTVTGGLVHTDYSSGRFQLPVGGVAEARIDNSGDASQPIYNWPTWWASGPNWPSAGEHDIGEGLGGKLTVNYHGTTNSANYGEPSGGPWGSAFHVLTLYRKASSADVYYDGVLKKSYPSGDNGVGEELILNVGKPGSRTPVTGPAGEVKVDYVRAWVPG